MRSEMFAKYLGIDAFKVIDLFTMDTRLNISPVYFKPGMAYGGSCLPKDLKGLKTIAYDNYLSTPVLNAISESNEIQKNRVFELIEQFGSKNVGIIGLAFKKGTDDLRYSPSVDLVEALLGKGYNVTIYDKNVQMSKLIGANKSFIDEKLPHISGLLTNHLEELINKSETIVVVHKINELRNYSQALENKNIVDLVRMEELRNLKNYEGIGW